MVTQTVSKAFTKVFGSRNDRLLKKYRQRVARINELETDVQRLSDPELKAKTQSFRDRLAEGESMNAVLPEALAVAREAMDRAVGMRNVFDPEHAFDPSRLPAGLQDTFKAVQAEVDACEPDPVMGGEPAPGHLQVDVPVELYDAIRELFPKSRPPFRTRPFDVQLIGAMVLHEGKIAEMKTGEGKTIVAPLACYLACLEGLRCHVVTVNDYLVQRDRDWVFPFYYRLGLTVGAIHPMHMLPPQKKAEAYQCDALYGTNSELGFDFLRDNMKLSAQEQFQKSRDFVIVDEIDSILIDEARTPLIISGPAHDEQPRYDLADKVARHLLQKQQDWAAADAKVQQTEMRIKGLEGDIRNARDKAKVPELRKQMQQLQEELPRLEEQREQFTQYYELEPEKKAAHLTHDGVAEAQKHAGIGSFYVGNNMDFPHLLENALRAHAVYKRDKDYVVQDGEVVIVDEFTGRLMVGRQWSDGLHQAVEAKENVKIKQETQTLATVTLQNFFKLYGRLAGMTGTAVTEATEFNEIYELDVVSIPTNVPVERVDRDDLIFLSTKDKWEAICDEIKRVHDYGRPVLVGTTSVEKSEVLSEMLRKKHGIQHSVLNAKAEHAAKESNMVEDAGRLGAVMIATNMAGRGTDIKLRPIERAALVHHWQQRDIITRDARPEMSDDELVALSYRHQATRELGLKKKDAEAMSNDELKLQLFRKWCVEDAYLEEKKAAGFDLEQCVATLDKLPDYQRHRLRVWDHVEALGGLHIVGTERHESRRIDNQLRGRAGRQGDKGSSRFFISMEDDLMKMFAGKATLTALSKLGMKEGDAIEHKWVTNSVQRAQKKVEERNYQIRKTLLDYDEVMEYQRNTFYATRQQVLEGRGVEELIFDYIGKAVDDAVTTYLADDYVQIQMAEWCRTQLDVSVDPSKLKSDDLDELQEVIRKNARTEVAQVVDVTLGEYMSNDTPPEDWDLKGLSSWAMSRFGVDLKHNRLRGMNVDDVRQELVEAAQQQVDKKDITGIGKFLETHLGEKELANWARNQFGIELVPEELAELEGSEAVDKIVEQAREAYAQREINYPVQFLMDLVMQGIQSDPQWAAGQVLHFANSRYKLDWKPEDLNGKQMQEIADTLRGEQEAWLRGGKLEAEADAVVAEVGHDLEQFDARLRERFGVSLTDHDKARLAAAGATSRDGQGSAHGPAASRNGRSEPVTPIEPRALYLEKGRGALRGELTQLERFVLLQILDQAWKDHLYGMDQLKDSIGLRGYAERDPRIEYKREGAANFQQMHKTVRDRVTELIFRARLTPNVQQRSAYSQNQQAQHATPDRTGPAASGRAQAQAAQRQHAAIPPGAPGAPAGAAAATAAAQAGTADQQADQAAAEAASNPDAGPRKRPASRKQRRAQEARQRKDSSGGHKQRKKKSR